MTTPNDEPHKPEPTSARDHLRKAEADFAPDILEALREAAKSTKSAWGTCTCGKRIQVEIQDAQAAIAASKALLDYTGGKPGTAEGEQHDQITIQRAVITPELVAEYTALEGCATPVVGARAGDASA